MKSDNVTALIVKGNELMDKMAAFMTLVDHMVEELLSFGEQEVTYN